MPKPVILTFVATYLPGFKGGGPIQSIANLVDHLGNEFCFRIVTSDRDLGEKEPYQDLLPGAWHKAGKAKVIYLRPEQLRLRPLAQFIRFTPHDVVYLNSFLNVRFTTLPLLVQQLRLAPRRPVLLAPRGEFSPGALALKALKKRLFIAGSRAFRLHRGLAWQASSDYEAEDIRRVMGGEAADVRIAPDMSRRPVMIKTVGNRRPGEPLRIVFLSRIVPKKNLLFVIEVLMRVTAPVALSIYGPREDRAYWARCSTAIAALPSHIHVTEYGPTPQTQVIDALAEHDLFFLPTKGENYGHVILEAMQAGLPVLISDQTPWRNLASAGVGRDLPLDPPEAFVRFIEHLANMSADDYRGMRSKAWVFANEHVLSKDSINANRDMFQSLAQRVTDP